MTVLPGAEAEVETRTFMGKSMPQPLEAKCFTYSITCNYKASFGGAVAEWSKALLDMQHKRKTKKDPRFTPWPGQSFKARSMPIKTSHHVNYSHLPNKAFNLFQN